MGPGGCDKTQEMIDEWRRQTKDLFEGNNQDVGPDAGILRGPIGEDDPSKTVKIIKSVIRTKYKHGRQLI